MQKSSVPPPLLGDQVIVAALAGKEESPVDVDDVEEVDFEADGPGQLQGFSEQACAPRRTLSMHTPVGCKMPLVRPEGSISLTWDTLGMCFIHSEFYMVPFNIAHDMSPAMMYGFIADQPPRHHGCRDEVLHGLQERHGQAGHGAQPDGREGLECFVFA